MIQEGEPKMQQEFDKSKNISTEICSEMIKPYLYLYISFGEKLIV